MEESSNTAQEIVDSSDGSKRFWFSVVAGAMAFGSLLTYSNSRQTQFDENQVIIQSDIMSITTTLTQMAQDHIRLTDEVKKNYEIDQLIHQQFADEIARGR